MRRELAQLALKCLWLKRKSSMSALFMCVAAKLSVTVSVQLIAGCDQLQSQVEAEAVSPWKLLSNQSSYSHVLFYGDPEGLH